MKECVINFINALLQSIVIGAFAGLIIKIAIFVIKL